MAVTKARAWKRDFHEDFDCEDPEFNAHYFDIMEDLLNKCPIPKINTHGGGILVCDYATVQMLQRDTDAVSNSYDGIMFQSVSERQRMIPIELDGPEHSVWRQVIKDFFTPRYFARQDATVQEVCHNYLEPLIPSGHADLVSDFTALVPTAVFFRCVLSMPETDIPWLRETLHEALYGPLDNRMPKFAEFTEYVADYLARRRADVGGQDLTAKILAAHVGDRPATDDEQLSCVLTMVAAALDTTSSFLSAGLYHFATHPSHRDRVLAEPEAMRRAIEELLRVYAPSFMNVKRATHDLRIGEREVMRGQIVATSTASACRDPRRFASPGTVDLDQPARPHLAFGTGPHNCPGASMARAIGRVVFTQALTHLRDLALAGSPSFVTGQLRMWSSLPVRFTAEKPTNSAHD